MTEGERHTERERNGVRERKICINAQKELGSRQLAPHAPVCQTSPASRAVPSAWVSSWWDSCVWVGRAPAVGFATHGDCSDVTVSNTHTHTHTHTYTHR